MIIQDKELSAIIGGSSSVSGTLINSICKLATLLFDIGKSIGSAMRYKKDGIICK